MTGLDVINGALRLIGVLAERESASSNTVNDALVSFNAMLDSWSNDSLIAFPVVRETFALSSVGLSQTYTWGTGGNLNSVRPIKVRQALIQLSGSSPAIELPLKILNLDEYSSVVLKTLQSNFPLYCYIDDAYPTRNVSVWPVPTDSTNTLVFYSTKPLGSAILNTALSVPPGYLRAMRYNLALELAPEFGRQIPEAVIGLANTSLAAIKRLNTKPRYLIVDQGLRAIPSAYNWKTDGYTR